MSKKMIIKLSPNGEIQMTTQGVKGKSLSFNLEFPAFCHCVLPIVDLGYNPILIKSWALISFVLLYSVLLFFALKK